MGGGGTTRRDADENVVFLTSTVSEMGAIGGFQSEE